MTEFKNKVVIVTGAGSGIGRACAVLFAKKGAKVVISDVDEKGGNESVDLIKKDGGEATFIKADVSKPEDCEALVKKTVEAYGRLDIGVNNAGIGGEANLTGDYSLDGWHKVININLNGVFYNMKYQITEMLKHGGGSIVNIASILGQAGFATASAYVAAKHGVVGLSKNAALEYSAQGIRVNSVGPGFIRTPLLKDMEGDKDTMDMLISLHPIGRLGQAEEVAELVIWLASDKASFVTGAYYPVDGGYLAR
jgi:NAD(P)-dependent dehydrogenase (short-subunit alcohol dehydrogenase family)